MKIGKFETGPRILYLAMAVFMTVGEYVKVVVWNETAWFDFVIVGYIYFLVVCWLVISNDDINKRKQRMHKTYD